MFQKTQFCGLSERRLTESLYGKNGDWIPALKIPRVFKENKEAKRGLSQWKVREDVQETSVEDISIAQFKHIFPID